MTLNNQSKEEMQEVLTYREEILKELTKEDTLLFDETMVAYIRQAIYRMTDYMKLEVKRITLKALIDQLKETLQLSDLLHTPELIFYNSSKQLTLEIDTEKIKQMLTNSIIYPY